MSNVKESRCQVRASKMAMKSAEDNLAKAIFQLEVERCKTSDLVEKAKTDVKV